MTIIASGLLQVHDCETLMVVGSIWRFK